MTQMEKLKEGLDAARRKRDYASKTRASAVDLRIAEYNYHQALAAYTDAGGELEESDCGSEPD